METLAVAFILAKDMESLRREAEAKNVVRGAGINAQSVWNFTSAARNQEHFSCLQLGGLTEGAPSGLAWAETPVLLVSRALCMLHSSPFEGTRISYVIGLLLLFLSSVS